MKSLGRLYVEDERDRGYLLASLLPEEPAQLPVKYWDDQRWEGNQGSNPYCVAFAWLHWMADGPVTHRAAPIYRPRDVYHDAQKLDKFPGQNYDGTTVRAGAKALVKRGVVTEYHWAWELEDVIQAVLTLGPVVVGTDWYEEMYTPDEDFIIRARGRKYGGHAYLINGVDTYYGRFRIKNSWGTEWGDNGHAFLPFSDFRVLLKQNGEACLATETQLDKYK